MERAMINSLLSKLSPGSPFRKLLDECSKDAERGMAFLTDELTTIYSFLEPSGEPTEQGKLWMRQLREMVFDVEDWIDDLMRETENKAQNHDRGGITGLVRKLKKMGSRDEISSQILYFKARVEAVSNRNMRYNLLSTSSRSGGLSDPSAAIASVPRSPYLVDLGTLVGIDDQREEIIDLLGGEGKQVKGAAIVGSGGIGKTSLARQVYRKLQLQFEHRAFVYVGRAPSVRAVLKNILNQVNGQQHYGLESLDEQQLIQKLKGFLTDKKCVGIPLAIIVMAGVVASLWEVKRQQQLVENNYPIPKCRLIRRWIAEGFIGESNEMSALEIGEGYLNELVIRSLIEPVPFDQNEEGECYTVHYLIHEFITSLSVEENFVTVPEVADKLEKYGLKSIGKLFHLKYLGLGGKDISKLPEQIGDLQHMQTLDVIRTNIRELPASALQWKMLHTLMGNIKLPDGVGKIQEVEELLIVNVTKDSSSQSIEELGQLRRLRILGVKWCIDESDSRIALKRQKFVNALTNLGNYNLDSLTLDTVKGSSLDFMMNEWPSVPKFKKVKLLRFHFEKIPQWMVASSQLSHIEIIITNVMDALKVLGGLPSLILLKLCSGAIPSEERCTINKDMFRCLKELWFMCLDGRIAHLSFEKGAMPNLENLILQFSICDPCLLKYEFPYEISHLSHLKHVLFKMDCEGADVSYARRVVSTINKAAHDKLYTDSAGVSEVYTGKNAMRRAINIQPSCKFELRTHQEGKPIQCAFKATSEDLRAVFHSSSGYILAKMKNDDSRLLKQTDDHNMIVHQAALACREAMVFALEKGFKRVTFTSDSKPLVESINSDEAPHPAFAKIIGEIKELKDKFKYFYPEHGPDAVKEADSSKFMDNT
ncbi:hypothetical protein EJB05_50218, partial [Eragrostis curvula]